MKTICMIPARLNSKRIPQKNLKLLDGKPLVAYSTVAARDSKVFDEIYINSESERFKTIAQMYGVKYYKRSPKLSKDTTVNDEFVYDFMKNIKGDILIQLLPTSPLITVKEIQAFVHTIQDSNCDTLVSVVNHKIACVYHGLPVNFIKTQTHIPSQIMTPVQSYATVLMGWTYESFLYNMENFGCAYHGGRDNTKYFPLGGFSTIDIDTLEDFRLAEAAIQIMKNSQPV